MEIRKFLSYISIALLLIVSLPPPLLSQGRVAGEVIMTRGMNMGTGVIFFVDDSGTDEGASNGSVTTPFATLDYATGRCGTSPAAASTGCTIFAMPGHAQTLTAADGIDSDVAGVSYIGLGGGGLRPAITFATAAAAEWNVDAANIEIANFEFIGNIGSGTHMIELTGNADGDWIHHNLFREGSTTGLSFIHFSGVADDVTIEHNDMYAPTAGNFNEAIFLESAGAAARIKIRGNTILGDFDVAPIHAPLSQTLTMLDISDNNIQQLFAANFAIEIITATTTGIITGNNLHTDAIATALDPGGLMNIDNQWVGGADLASHRIPEDSEYFPGLGYRVIKTDNDVSGDNDPLFTVTGTVAITLLVGEVTTVLAGGLNTITLETSNDVALHAATTVTADADGTMYLYAGDQSTVLSGAAAPVTEIATVEEVPRNWIIVGNTGVTVTIRNDLNATGTGIIRWTLFYIPISAGATVVSA